MTSRSPRTRRAIAASVLAVTLGVAGFGLAAPAHATADFALERLAGTDRIDTAAEVALATFPTGATNAMIARADDFPDALAGNYAAGSAGAPILLSHTDDVPTRTLEVLDGLGVSDVTLLGGTAALDDSVATELTDAGYTVGREAGEDRYETAAAVATSQDAATIGETADGRTALLATGEGFADALSGGPLSYNAQLPLLLTPSDQLGEDASGALETLEIAHVLILGGTAAISPAVEVELTAMGLTFERLAGDTRYDTTTDIAEFATANLDFVDTAVNVATGAEFPDALTGGPHAGEEAAPILLADQVDLDEACTYLNSVADTVADGHLFGGTDAVSDDVQTTLEGCGGAAHPNSNQTFTVTAGRGSVTQEPGTSRSFAFDDITVDEVEIVLFECANVTVTDGVVTFAAIDGAADPGTVAAEITAVNGLPILSPGQQTTGASGDGTVEFDVAGDGTEECFVSVVFADADADGSLAVGADGAPTEGFGISGSTTFTEPEPDPAVVAMTDATQTTAGDFDTLTFGFSTEVAVVDVALFEVYSDSFCSPIGAVTEGAAVASGDGTDAVVIDLAEVAGAAGDTIYVAVQEGAVADGGGNENTASDCVAVELA